MERWPTAPRGERSALSPPAAKAQNTSRLYMSDGGGRDTYICQLGSHGRVGRSAEQTTTVGAERYHFTTICDRPLRRYEMLELPAALALPQPANPSYSSRSVATLLSPLPPTHKYRPHVRRRHQQPKEGDPTLGTDKITQFLPPAGLQPGQGSLADQPSASWTGHVPRSPKTPRSRTQQDAGLAELRALRRPPTGHPASSPVKAKILGYTGHVPNARSEIDSFGARRVWESPATTA
eukprot:TRINITY_DN17065_c0_g1_i1.p1 TRINITY_DN17065_c0_g1~~TRINITY_DN17065_c0_g1_i1.p1  ORF type:complete len:236 (+),score=55.87 TRINITY_DN17065_c0_g1_i1:83-790(+)